MTDTTDPIPSGQFNHSWSWPKSPAPLSPTDGADVVKHGATSMDTLASSLVGR